MDVVQTLAVSHCKAGWPVAAGQQCWQLRATSGRAVAGECPSRRKASDRPGLARCSAQRTGMRARILRQSDRVRRWSVGHQKCLSNPNEGLCSTQEESDLWLVVQREIEGRWCLAAEIQATSAERAIAHVAKEQGSYRVRKRDGTEFQHFQVVGEGAPQRVRRLRRESPSR